MDTSVMCGRRVTSRIRVIAVIVLAVVLWSTLAMAGQCRGVTKKGARCKREAGNQGYCYQHR